MKVPSLICLAAAVTISTQAEAQKKGSSPAKPKATVSDQVELGPLKDKFAAFKKAVFEGTGYYTDKNADLRAAHANLYTLITKSLVEDRIREDTGFYYNEQLFLIAEEAKKMRGNKDALQEYQVKKLRAKLTNLLDGLKRERKDKVDEKILTPKLNSIQVNLEELVKFGQDEKILSSSEASAIRYKMNKLSRNEKRAKSDKQISDKERESLMEEANDLLKETAKQLLD